MPALSTVGMAAYSALAELGGPRSAAEVAEHCVARLCFPVAREQLEAALYRLVALGRVRQEADRFEALGPRGYVVTARDRSDGHLPDGGWKDWLVQGANGTRVPLDQVVNG